MSRLPTHYRRVTILLSLLILGVLVFSLTNTTTASATRWSPKEACEFDRGVWDAVKETCTFTKHVIVTRYNENLWSMLVDEFCGGKFTSQLIYKVGYYDYKQLVNIENDPEYYDWYVTSVSCYGLVLREARECKLIDMDAAAPLGTDHTITATYKGYANYLRLWDGNQYYRLPVVAGSEHFAGNGRWTAEFATADPLTGAPYAPTGNYKAMCFGSSGTAGGTAKLTLTP